MTEVDLKRYQARHNLLAVLKGIGWLLAAAVAWFVSYWVMWFIVGLLCVQFGSIWNWMPSGRLVRNAAWIGMGILALEGLRFGRRLLKREIFARTVYYQFEKAVRSGPNVVAYMAADLGGIAYVVSESLLAVPIVFAEHKAALYPLHKLGVIWEQVKDDGLKIKLHPHFVDNWLQRDG